MARKYLIETFGCQMNVHDSERMAGLLEQAGFEPTGDAADADVLVINTCSVRERAQDKLYTRLGELRQLASEQGHDPIIAVAGEIKVCGAGLAPYDVIRGVDYTIVVEIAGLGRHDRRRYRKIRSRIVGEDRSSGG